MSEERISKKELLEQTGISYGQLYRWKRERLIPEDWFIKQASFTGQETYFPKDQILARVKAILDMKDSHSLDDMARLFSPNPKDSIAASDLGHFDAINQELFSQLQQGKDARLVYETGEAVFLGALSSFIGKQTLDVEAATKLAANTLSGARSNSALATNGLIFKTGNGPESFHVIFYSGNNTPLFDNAVVVLGTLPLQETAELLGSFILAINDENKDEK